MKNPRKNGSSLNSNLSTQHFWKKTSDSIIQLRQLVLIKFTLRELQLLIIIIIIITAHVFIFNISNSHVVDLVCQTFCKTEERLCPGFPPAEGEKQGGTKAIKWKMIDRVSLWPTFSSIRLKRQTATKNRSDAGPSESNGESIEAARGSTDTQAACNLCEACLTCGL